MMRTVAESELERRRAEGRSVLGSGLVMVVLAVALAAIAGGGLLGAVLVALGAFGGLVAAVGLGELR